MKRIKVIIHSLTTAILALPVLVQAVAPTIPGVGTATVDSTYTSLLNLFRYAFGIALGLAVVYTIWGAISWATSGGDAEKAGEARNKLVYGIIGIVAIAGIYTLVNMVAVYFGLGTTIIL